MPAKQGTNFVITDFSVNKDKWTKLVGQEGAGANFRFACFQIEVAPDTGREHIQGFIQLKAKKTATWVKEAIGDNPHVEFAKKVKCDDECAKAQEYYEKNMDVPMIMVEEKEKMKHSPCGYHYCRKRYTRKDGPWEVGDRVGAGQRTDLEEIQLMLNEGATPKKISEDYFATWVKATKAIDRYYEEHKKRQLICDITEDMFYDWQKELVEIFSGPADGRRIHWRYDYDGHAGKTQFSNWLYNNKGAILVQGCEGKKVKQQLLNYYKRTGEAPPIVIWDMPRAIRDPTYDVLESIKNGHVQCEMYECEEIVWKEHPHVLVFANHTPNYDMLSRDRWECKEIKKPVDDVMIV